MKTSSELRKSYLDFFVKNGHTLRASPPIVPQGDATLMFNSAGMVPFKPYVLGLKKDLSRATSSQKCVRTTDIDWCEAAGNYVCLHVGEQSHLLRETMNHLEFQLDPQRFVRIHRCTIVNVDRIQELRSSFNGEHIVLLLGGTRLTLSRGYRDTLQARLGKSF